MNPFGYLPIKPKTMTLEPNGSILWQKLIGKHPELQGCMACGACTGVCPRNTSHRMSVRTILLELSRGTGPTAQPADCLMCNKCALVCPRNLPTRLALFSIVHPEV